MNINELKEVIIDTVKYEFTDYNRRKIVKKIIESKIGTYSPKKDKSSINLLKLDTIEKINNSLNFSDKVIKLIDEVEFEKSYKYSILVKVNSIMIEGIKDIYTNIDDDYYLSENYDGINHVLIKDFSDKCIIKFHKLIEVIDKEQLIKRNVRYPIVIIYYKNYNMMEIKFDKLSYKSDYNFYKITMEARMAKLINDLRLEWEYFSLEKVIKDIGENHEDLAKVIIWSFEAARSKGLTLKVGEDGIMPFIGEIELIIKALKGKYQSAEVSKALKEISDYLDTTKEFANEKFRIISWEKGYNPRKRIIEDLGEHELNMKINFEYKENRFDLIQVYDNEINDMERWYYVIESIFRIAKGIGEL
ncbi:hypothetical protein QYB55_001090 [Clostridium perfringens]|nr:hypothetical protein [Clostridium perfringens]